MHRIINTSAYVEDIEQGRIDFAAGKPVEENPHQGNRGVAWEIGWLNEMQAWLGIVRDVKNAAGDRIAERIAELEERAKARETAELERLRKSRRR